MEDWPDHAAGLGLEDELSQLLAEPSTHWTKSRTMQRFSENGARPVHPLGGLNTSPLERLGALVFQPHNSDTLYWAGPLAETRIVGCALGFAPGDTGWENVSSERRWVSQWDGFGRTSTSGPGGPGEKDGGCAARVDQFFALGRVCGAGPRNSRPQRKPQPGADASAIDGRTERSGCTAAEPYPLSRRSSLPLRARGSQTAK